MSEINAFTWSTSSARDGWMTIRMTVPTPSPVNSVTYRGSDAVHRLCRMAILRTAGMTGRPPNLALAMLPDRFALAPDQLEVRQAMRSTTIEYEVVVEEGLVPWKLRGVKKEKDAARAQNQFLDLVFHHAMNRYRTFKASAEPEA